MLSYPGSGILYSRAWVELFLLRYLHLTFIDISESFFLVVLFLSNCLSCFQIIKSDSVKPDRRNQKIFHIFFFGGGVPVHPDDGFSISSKSFGHFGHISLRV